MAIKGENTSYAGDGRPRSSDGLSVAERERLLQPHLPAPRIRRSTRSHSRKLKTKPIRSFLKSKLYFLIYFLVHIFLGIYTRLRQGYHAIVDRVLAIVYYHHRTPELIQKDVKGLSQLPEHLSAVLTLNKDEEALEVLMDEVAELAAWSSCAGIPMLSIYEKTGVLKSYIPALYEVVITKLASYYGHASQQPTLQLFAPNHPLYTPPPSSTRSSGTKSNTASITLLLLSAADGRDTLVDLTKTLAEMAQHGKLSPHDISTKLIDAELSEMMSTPTPASPPLDPADSSTRQRRASASRAAAATRSGGQAQRDGTDGKGTSSVGTPLIKPEPDLLLIFGPIVRLDGFPPWQIRLTEIFCTGDKSSGITGNGEAVEYQRFLQGLWSFANADMKFGR